MKCVYVCVGGGGVRLLQGFVYLDIVYCIFNLLPQLLKKKIVCLLIIKTSE